MSRPLRIQYPGMVPCDDPRTKRGMDLMNTEGFKRKLTAILSTDVKGYSRLMGDDESETVRTLTTYREAITNLVQEYEGRVVD